MIGVSMHEERELPTIYVRSQDLPEFMQWPINSDHYVVMRVSVIGKRAVTSEEDRHRGAKFEGELKIVGMQALGNEPVDIKTLENNEWNKIKASVHDSGIA